VTPKFYYTSITDSEKGTICGLQISTDSAPVTEEPKKPASGFSFSTVNKTTGVENPAVAAAKATTTVANFEALKEYLRQNPDKAELVMNSLDVSALGVNRGYSLTAHRSNKHQFHDSQSSSHHTKQTLHVQSLQSIPATSRTAAPARRRRGRPHAPIKGNSTPERRALQFREF
jgi:hypothetical protein